MSAIADKIASVLRTKAGRPMTLRRVTLGPNSKKIPLDVTIYGTTDGATITKIIGSIVQTGTHVLFSNAEIAERQWPGPPLTNDKIVIETGEKTLGAVDTKYLGSEILVHLCEITG